MPVRPLLKSLLADESGATVAMLAGSMSMLVGAGAIALDVGSLYMAKRKLQGLADSAAMSVTESDFANASDGTIQDLLVSDGSGNVKVVSLVPGKYTRDPRIAPDKRFVPQPASGANAMEVKLQQDVRLTFGAIITGSNTTPVEAKAVAMRESMAAYALSTKLTNLGGDLPNRILSSLAGTNLNLSSDDIAAMTDNQVGLFEIADIIAAREGLVGSSYETIFAQAVSPGDFLAAVAEASDDPAVQSLIEGIAGQSGGQDVSLAQFINLGDIGRSSEHSAQNPLTLDALTLTRAALQMSHGDTWEIALGVTIPGQTGSTLHLAGTNATVQSPMMTVTAAKTYVLRSSTNRLYLETKIAAGTLGSITLPIYVEAAKGEARLKDINCEAQDKSVDGTTLGVKPSIGMAAIGSINLDDFDDFSSDLAIEPAALVNTALVRVEGSSKLSIGGNSEQSKLFTVEEIEERVWKSVFTSDATSALAKSLTQHLSLTVKALGLGVGTSGTGALVGNSLALAAPAIDQVLLSAMQTSGVGLGVSDVTVNKMTCGMPILVG